MSLQFVNDGLDPQEQELVAQMDAELQAGLKAQICSMEHELELIYNVAHRVHSPQIFHA